MSARDPLDHVLSRWRAIRRAAAPRSWRAITVAGAVLVSACGTVVGNPRQPKQPPAPPPAVVYELPSIDFAPPDETTADETGLALSGWQAGPYPRLAAADVTSIYGEPYLLREWARRTVRVVKQTNALSERINTILTKKADQVEADGDIRRFKGLGPAGQLSGRVGPLSGDDAHAYEAVLCLAGAPFSRLRWSEDRRHVTFERDFSPKSDDDDEVFAMRTRVVMDLDGDGGLDLDFANQGEWSDVDTDLLKVEGGGLVERAAVSRDGAGGWTLKATSDRYQTQPEAGAFAGDHHLVARATPITSGPLAGAKAVEFLGYAKGRGGEGPCAQAFDEASGDLFATEPVSTPWCFGRPSTARRFRTAAEYAATAQSLAPVGILPARELQPVRPFDGFDCD